MADYDLQLALALSISTDPSADTNEQVTKEAPNEASQCDTDRDTPTLDNATWPVTAQACNGKPYVDFEVDNKSPWKDLIEVSSLVVAGELELPFADYRRSPPRDKATLVWLKANDVDLSQFTYDDGTVLSYDWIDDPDHLWPQTLPFSARLTASDTPVPTLDGTAIENEELVIREVAETAIETAHGGAILDATARTTAACTTATTPTTTTTATTTTTTTAETASITATAREDGDEAAPTAAVIANDTRPPPALITSFFNPNPTPPDSAIELAGAPVSATMEAASDEQQPQQQQDVPAEQGGNHVANGNVVMVVPAVKGKKRVRVGKGARANAKKRLKSDEATRNEMSAIEMLARPANIPTPWWVARNVVTRSQLLCDTNPDDMVIYWAGPELEFGVRYVGKAALPAETWVCLYLGEVIDRKEMLRRTRAKQDDYIAQLDVDLFVDAQHYGDLGRFLNSRCIPNCEMIVVTIDGHMAIGIRTCKVVNSGEDLCTDYGWTQSSSKKPMQCKCGALACTGLLVHRTESERRKKMGAALT